MIKELLIKIIGGRKAMDIVTNCEILFKFPSRNNTRRMNSREKEN